MKLYKRFSKWIKEDFLYWLRYEFPSLIPIILLVGIVAFVAYLIFGYIHYYIHNYIDEGFVVDKDYDPAYTSIVNHSNGNGGTYFQYVYYPESYQFKLEREKDGETVSCWISVPESEYEKYNIGDYYP